MILLIAFLQVRRNSAVAIGNAVRSFGQPALDRVLPVLK